MIGILLPIRFYIHSNKKTLLIANSRKQRTILLSRINYNLTVHG